MYMCEGVCVWVYVKPCPKTSLGWLIPDAGRKGRWENGFWTTRIWDAWTFLHFVDGL